MRFSERSGKPQDRPSKRRRNSTNELNTDTMTEIDQQELINQAVDDAFGALSEAIAQRIYDEAYDGDNLEFCEALIERAHKIIQTKTL